MIRIDTLGGLTVRGDDGKPLAGAAAQPRRMALLAVLARAGDRGVRREKLLALLWPDAEDERGQRALAQALYALRTDLGAGEAISGARELRLNPAVVSSDVAECAAAIARGDNARAVALYGGPFLDGFHLPGVDLFSRWVEEERRVLVQEHERALESLARAAGARGEAAQSVTWWRRLAALEPLNARVTVGLMEALDASGDRAGAIRHAHVYRLLVQQELDLPPDKEVLALAERLRRAAEEAPPSVASAVSIASRPTADEREGRPLGQTATDVRPAAMERRWRTFVAAGLVLVVGAAAVVMTRDRSVTVRQQSTANGGTSVVAIGHIVAFESDTVQASMAAAVADLLTTSLARVPGIQVVSHGRMLELMRLGGTLGDTSAGGFVNAARQAGATEVIDGTLYARPGGRLRLDVRRVDLASGAIGDVHTIEGNDLFALVDSGTTQLVAAMGTEAPSGSVADVTTRSVLAYRSYERGVDALYRSETRTALALFDRALAHDSMFALAAYYGALAAADAGLEAGQNTVATRMARAKRLATRAPDRERLNILADWAYRTSSPTLHQFAESLVVRYPSEVEGQLYSGISRVMDGEFLAAVVPLERAIATDSLALLGAMARCAACEALRWLVSAYFFADSMPGAERAARRWMRLEPRSTVAMTTLMDVLHSQDRLAEAESLYRRIVAIDPALDNPLRVAHSLRSGEYETSDRLLAAETRVPDAAKRRRAYWVLALSRRQQGRLADAFDATRQMRRVLPKGTTLGLQSDAVLEAQVQLERGNARIAAALFDSIARLQYTGQEPSAKARQLAWGLTHAGGARVAAGDTARLDRLIDSLQALGAESGFARDRRLHHHVRGLLLAARGDTVAAIRELNAAIYSTSGGYSRTNLALANLYLLTSRPRDAIAMLQPALRGSIEGSNLYANRTELHELLARSWDAVGGRDSAVAHYAIVAKAWSAPDTLLASRARLVRSRLAAVNR